MLLKKKIKHLGCALLLGLALPLSVLSERGITEKRLDAIEQQYNKFARQRVRAWQQLIQDNIDATEQEKLHRVNTFFNANIQFFDDQVLWDKKDYWATPIETLSMGGGDCEDYAIAKYFTLKQLGVDENKLRLTYVKAIELNQAHMVLTYFKNKRAIPLVLDNLIIEIKYATQRTDLIPVYSFNGAGLWLTKPKENRFVSDSAGLSLWQSLILKIDKGQ
ncbi:MAG: putative transglutaminase-like cysteine proteinase [Methylophagaceae bacterium]|jgi:predicted transglutaminase-like cysteine proteinase